MASQIPLKLLNGKIVQFGATDTIPLGNIPSGIPLTTFYASSTTNATTASATYVQVTGMTLTPGAGSYIVNFNATTSNPNNNAQNNFAIYVNGVVVADSVRVHTEASVNAQLTISILTQITGVLVSQVVEVRWLTNSPTATVYNRTFSLLKIA
jgi:hypothetical protein